MKTTARVLALLVPALMGCAHPGITQVPPPSSPGITLTCTMPASCTASNPACTFVFARAVCGSASTCPANTAGNTNFTALNASAPTASCSYTDSTPPSGQLVIYTASTIQSGLTSQPSSPSNNGTPTSVPVQPTAPSSLAGTSQAALAPPVSPSVAPTPVLSSTKPSPGNLVASARLSR